MTEPVTRPRDYSASQPDSPGLPRWVVVVAIVAAIVVLVVVSMMLLGGGQAGHVRPAH
jgi:hypothetical protein